MLGHSGLGLPNLAALGATAFPQTLDLNLIADVDAFFGPTLTIQISPGLLTDTDNFFAPTMGVFLSPSLLTDTDNFFGPSVLLAGQLGPQLFFDVDTLYAPSVLPGPRILSPIPIVDVDFLYAPNVFEPGVQFPSPNLITDADMFFTPHVFRGAGPSFYPDGWESQIGVWRRPMRTGKRYRIFPPADEEE